MSVLNRLSRRAVLAGKVALATLAALPGAALARSATGSAGPDPEPVASVSERPPRWHDATAEEIAALVGSRFRVASAVHGTMVLRLAAAEPGASGGARPPHLPRREGVTLVFDGPDTGLLGAGGSGIFEVGHPRMGTAQLYATMVPRQSGGHTLEIVLN